MRARDHESEREDGHAGEKICRFCRAALGHVGHQKACLADWLRSFNMAPCFQLCLRYRARLGLKALESPRTKRDRQDISRKFYPSRQGWNNLAQCLHKTALRLFILQTSAKEIRNAHAAYLYVGDAGDPMLL